jgi:alkylated DNA repair protein alkB family protein 1
VIRFESCYLFTLVGLQIVPSILPPETQVEYISRLLHRDLANPHHKTNINADYHVPYPGPISQGEATDESSEDLKPYTVENKSFFTQPQSSKEITLVPKDSAKHKPLNMSQYLQKKLRWLTLGTQYDWPTRKYPSNPETVFPPDFSGLVSGLFPHIKAESGVVLLYSPKDYMPVHRDVSEQCERGLASFSLGCDGIFVVARGEEEVEGGGRTVAIRVKSGDVVHMDGETRWAWHAMPRTIAGTCPPWLENWPVGTPGATEEDKKMFEKWKGYMAGKRLNISCRQVWD